MSTGFSRPIATVLGFVGSLPLQSVDCVVARPVSGLAAVNDVVAGISHLWTAVQPALRSQGTTWLLLTDRRDVSRSLKGLAWKVALELQHQDWFLRNAMIACEPTNPRGHETGFLLTRQIHYFFHLRAMKQTYGKNPGDVVLPAGESLVARCIAAGCAAGGVVLNPFGDPEVTVSAQLHGCRVVEPAVGIEVAV